MKLLGDRVENLQRHFNQAEADIKDITVSTGKIVSRGDKIGNFELSPPEAGPALSKPS